MDALKSGQERMKGVVNARRFDHERTKVWWTHESLMDARMVWWTHENLLMNARKSGEQTKVWWTHESLDMNARKVCWTHESLGMNVRKSG